VCASSRKLPQQYPELLSRLGRGGKAERFADFVCRLTSGAEGTECKGGANTEGREAPVSGMRSQAVEEAAGELRVAASGVPCAVRAEDPLGGLAVLSNVNHGEEATVVMPVVGGLSGSAIRSNGNLVDSFTIVMDEQQTGISRRESVAAEGGTGVWQT